MTDNKISNYANINKSNHKILKFITIILSILIIICIIFLIIGFIDKFQKISENKQNKQNKENIQRIIQSDYTLFYPSESQIISVNYNGNNKVLLRYQLNGENKLILIDLQNKEIITKVNFKKAKTWKIE